MYSAARSIEECDSPTTTGAGAGGREVCPGSHESLGTAPDLQGAAPAAQEGSVPTTGGTGSDSARHSQSPVLSEGGGEDHAVQGVDSTEAGEVELPRKRGKRRLPLPDLDAIDDVEERRRQRRLIKNRNTAAASRVRKQLELEELSRRMRHLEQDNAALRSHIDGCNAEIARLREVVDGLHRSHGSLPHAVHPAHDSPSLGPGSADQGTVGNGNQRELTGEALHQPSAQQQALHADHRMTAHDQSRNASCQMGGPAGVWGDPRTLPGQKYGQQQQNPHQPIHLEPALPEDQFVRAFGGQHRPGRAAPGLQCRAAPMASSATSSLSTAKQATLASARGRHHAVPSARPPHTAPHRHGGGAGDAEEQLLPANPGAPGTGSHADFLAFPWPEVLEMVDQQERQPPDPADGWQR